MNSRAHSEFSRVSAITRLTLGELSGALVGKSGNPKGAAF